MAVGLLSVRLDKHVDVFSRFGLGISIKQVGKSLSPPGNNIKIKRFVI